MFTVIIKVVWKTKIILQVSDLGLKVILGLCAVLENPEVTVWDPDQN